MTKGLRFNNCGRRNSFVLKIFLFVSVEGEELCYYSSKICQVENPGGAKQHAFQLFELLISSSLSNGITTRIVAFPKSVDFVILVDIVSLDLTNAFLKIHIQRSKTCFRLVSASIEVGLSPAPSSHLQTNQ